MELTETKPIEYFKLGPPAGAFGKLGRGSDAVCQLKLNSKSRMNRNEASTEGRWKVQIGREG
jgi:hypothetical protein